MKPHRTVSMVELSVDGGTTVFINAAAIIDAKLRQLRGGRTAIWFIEGDYQIVNGTPQDIFQMAKTELRKVGVE